MDFKKIILSYIFLLLISSVVIAGQKVAGQKYEYLLYSENASAFMVLVKVIEDGRHESLASVSVKFSSDNELRGYAGNIALTKTDHPELEFPGLARKLTERIMVAQSTLNEPELKAPDAEFSLVMAVAGYETINGTHPYRYPVYKTRQREDEAKENIISIFSDNGLTIAKESIYGCGDQDYVLQLARQVDPGPHLTLFKATYDILFLTEPSSFEPVSKWESIHRYSYINDQYQRTNKRLPSGSSYGLGFIVGDHFYSKRALSKTPVCSGSECDRKERERAEAAEFRNDMQDLYLNRTAGDITEYFQGFKRNNELGDSTLDLYKRKKNASWLHVVDHALIYYGAKQLVREIITYQIPALRNLLHDFQSDNKVSDVIDIHVTGSHEDIYDSVPVLNNFMANEGEAYHFQLKRVPQNTIKQHSADAVVHLTKKLSTN